MGESTAPSLYTLGIPRLAEADARIVDEHRRAHEPRYGRIVPAHFTLVFACSAVPEADYVAHVRTVAARSRALAFTCKRAAVVIEEDGSALVFLLADEGRTELSQLHDRLYEGPLAPQLRQDLPYVPHITLASSTDRGRAEELCARWNSVQGAVRGTIDALSVCSVEDGALRILATCPLRGRR